MFGLDPADYTDTRDLRRALRSFGVEIGHRRIQFTKKSAQDMGLDFDAIIGTRPGVHGNWHWLVWDAKNHVLLDPNPNKQTNGHRSAHHYLEILSS